MANLRTWTIVFASLSLTEVATCKSVNEISTNSFKAVTARIVNETLSNPIKCPSNETGLCWPKCCFANQVFSIDRLGCIPANKSFILQKPEIFKIRYRSNKIVGLVCFYVRKSCKSLRCCFFKHIHSYNSDRFI